MKVKADRDEASPYAAMLAAQVYLVLIFFYFGFSLKEVNVPEIVFIYLDNNNLNLIQRIQQAFRVYRKINSF
jgi:hypothetical protein